MTQAKSPGELFNINRWANNLSKSIGKIKKANILKCKCDILGSQIIVDYLETVTLNEKIILESACLWLVAGSV